MRRLVPALVVAAIGCAEPAPALPYGADASSCSTCHAAQHEAWSDSPHASSGTSPVFEAMLPEVERAWGQVAADACVDCHQPGHGGDVGIGCVACHGATGNTAERDGRLRVDLSVPLAGPRGTGDNGAHATRRSELLGSASLCGTCHELTGPELLVEPTLSEYRESRFAEAGISCQGCHMRGGEHRFVGVDPAWGADEATRQRAIDDARALVDEALTVDLALSPEGDLVVSLENVGAGHAVPTGSAFLRDLWVDVSFDDGPETRVISLGAEPTRDGVPVALITDADHVEHRSLGPGERREARVTMPSAAISAVATVRLRAVRWEILDALGLEDRRAEVPTIDVTTARHVREARP